MDKKTPDKGGNRASNTHTYIERDDFKPLAFYLAKFYLQS